MSVERVDLKTPRMQAAVAELQARIQQAYSTATFAVAPGDDPDGLYVLATVDVDDTDAVVDVYIDRLLTLQIDDGLPIYVVPLRLRSHMGRRLRQADSNASATRAPSACPVLLVPLCPRCRHPPLPAAGVVHKRVAMGWGCATGVCTPQA